MFLQYWKPVLCSILFLTAPGLAADLTDQLAYCSYVPSGHPKPANDGHLKTGQRE